MAPSSKAPVRLTDIPTVSSLYANKALTPSSNADTTAYKPSKSHNATVSLIRTDITTLQTTCIVNAANKSLLGGGGVDYAIHRAAGPSLLAECRTLHGCATGSAKITAGYNLPAQYVIHAVGPIYDEDDVKWSEEMLKGCYTTSLELAREKGAKSVAFSALSTGVYGYPSKDAAEVACRAVRAWLDGHEGSGLEKIVFCNFMEKDEKAYFEALPNVFPPFKEEDGDVEEAGKMEQSSEKEIEKSSSLEEQEKPLAERLPSPPTGEPVSDHAGGPDKKRQKLDRDINEAPVDSNAEVEKEK